MKLITVDVPFPDRLEMPTQKLEPGEYITARIVEISKLSAEFKGLFLCCRCVPSAKLLVCF